MIWRSFDPLPLGIAILLLGAGVTAVTVLSLAQENVSYSRTEWMAFLAMLLAAFPIVLYVLHLSPLFNWWRSFWTVALVAYLMHFWWAFFQIFNGDFSAVAARQGWVAYTNLAVTVLWTLDIFRAWLIPQTQPWWSWILSLATWAFVTTSFLVASVFFRSGIIAAAGYALAIALLIAFGVRVLAVAYRQDDRKSSPA